MNKRVLRIYFLISIVGLLAVYFFWPKYEKLPILETVSSFQLENVHGGTYSLNNEKIKLVTFFYTHCPDICPMTMMDLMKLQAQLQKEGIFGNKVELVAISLDPENDTPKVIKRYSEGFSADPLGWKWLRGSEGDTKEIANSLKMQYQKLEGDFFSHSTTMFLLDDENNIRALYDMAISDNPIDTTKILEDISILIEGY
ncbi:SCO family protein [Bacillus salitolerans]|uniref:SCO family protein n=1 Tax=Bacillus salitolerans TaxID=1437434 RepID=A0ABW4LMZ6_9BACI